MRPTDCPTWGAPRALTKVTRMDAGLADDSTARAKLEKQILSNWEPIRFGPDSRCYEETNLNEYTWALNEYTWAWHELALYYGAHDDNTIAIELVAIYRQSVDRFVRLIEGSNTLEDCKALVREALLELETCMDDIIIAVRNRLSESRFWQEH